MVWSFDEDEQIDKEGMTGKRKRARLTIRKTTENVDILNEKNITWNEASKKVQNTKEWKVCTQIRRYSKR